MTTTSWHERAAQLKIDGRAVIGGQRVWAVAGQQFENLSPIDGRKLGMVARCDAADVDVAGRHPLAGLDRPAGQLQRALHMGPVPVERCLDCGPGA